METTIKIKNLGNSRGTVGWLLGGLTDGSITIEERIGKSGHKVLELKYPGCVQLLAGFDFYDLVGTQYGDRDHTGDYQMIPRIGNPAVFGDQIGCTDACWHTLCIVCEQWIDSVKSDRVDEQPVKITIIRG
jgi:hypothetical protein